MNTLLRSKDDILICYPRDPEVKGQSIDHVTYYINNVHVKYREAEKWCLSVTDTSKCLHEEVL